MTSPSVSERLKAVDLLYENGDLRSVPILQKISEDDNSIQVRYMAQRSIFLLSEETRDISGDEADSGQSENLTIKLDKFTSSYKLGDNQQKKRLIKAAVHFKATHALPFLREQATIETDPQIKGTLLVGISLLGGATEIKFLSGFSGIAEPVVRHYLVDALAQINSPSVYPLICSFLSDEDNNVKLRVVGILKKLGKNGIIQLIDHMLSSDQFWIRDAGAYALSVLSSTHFLPLLRKGMRDSDRRIREKIRRGIELLVEKGCEEARDLLNKFSDMTMAFQDDGSLLLSQIQIGAPGGSDPLFSEVGAHRLSEVNRIIAEFDTEKLANLCAAIQGEEDPMILVQMLKAVSIIGNPESITYIENCLSSDEPAVRMATIDTISSIAGDSTPDNLDPLLYDEDPMVRASAVVALKRAYPQPALRTLQEMAEHENIAFRNAALYALSGIADEACIPIINIMLSDSDDGIKEQVQQLVEHLPESIKNHLN